MRLLQLKIKFSWNYVGGRHIAANKKTRRNDEINALEVRVINDAGQQLGIQKIQKALAMAKELNMDLVEIVPNAEPPVCRIMDFGKFKFEQNKKAQQAKKKQKQVQVKEIKFRPGTEEGDYQVKMRKLIKFLEGGDKAKITMRFRGREMAHQELGMEFLNRIESDLQEYGSVEQRPQMEGRQMVMVFAPLKH